MTPRASVVDRAMDATYAEVAQRGLAGLTVKAVAARAGSSRATLYRHWAREPFRRQGSHSRNPGGSQRQGPLELGLHR